MELQSQDVESAQGIGMCEREGGGDNEGHLTLHRVI